MSKKPKVGIVMGSANDAEVLKVAKAQLEEFGIEVEMRALSAHRSPKQACEWAETAEERGFQVLIASAGMAAHLAGVVAAHSALPVIGVPLDGGIAGGLDSLLSTVQMPKGTPVATVAVGKAGATNAALLALRILALSNPEMKKVLDANRLKVTEDQLASDKKLNG